MSATQRLAKTNTFFYLDSATGKHQNLSLGPNHYLEVLLLRSRRDGPRCALTATPWPGGAGPAHSRPPPPRPSSQARSCTSPHSSGPHHLLPCLLFLACLASAKRALSPTRALDRCPAQRRHPLPLPRPPPPAPGPRQSSRPGSTGGPGRD